MGKITTFFAFSLFCRKNRFFPVNREIVMLECMRVIDKISKKISRFFFWGGVMSAFFGWAPQTRHDKKR
jgi:hypothetical protein